MSAIALCRHYDPVASKLGCTAGAGRTAPRDCACAAYDPAPAGLDPAERQRCEVWTRVMGYHRPVSAFNAGKQSEHAERVPFRERPEAIVSDAEDGTDLPAGRLP